MHKVVIITCLHNSITKLKGIEEHLKVDNALTVFFSQTVPIFRGWTYLSRQWRVQTTQTSCKNLVQQTSILKKWVKMQTESKKHNYKYHFRQGTRKPVLNWTWLFCVREKKSPTWTCRHNEIMRLAILTFTLIELHFSFVHQNNCT